MTAVFTIVSKNYLAFARTLMASVRKHHPEMARFVVLVDRVDGAFDPAAEGFTVVTSDDLPIPQSRWFHFKYTILELNTAVKPYAVEYLAAHWPIDKLLYLDPDIKVYGSLGGIEATLNSANIVLTPHLLAPMADDGKTPSDLEIMRSGAYNLGFIGLRMNPATHKFVEWWQRRLYDHCYIDFSKGLFTDQKWIDLVPCAFPDVHLERSPRYNVAYWNISQRPVSAESGTYTVNGEPLAFFHFSGFDPLNPHRFSKYQNRYTLDQLGDVCELALEYGRELLANGYKECRQWQYAYGYFENGEPILDLCRKYASAYAAIPAAVVDPFSADGYRAYVEYWTASAEELSGTGLTRLAQELWENTPELQRLMPALDSDGNTALLEWLRTQGRQELALPEALIAPIDRLLFQQRRQESERQRGENERPIREQAVRRIEAEWNTVPASVVELIRDRADEISGVLLQGTSLIQWLCDKVQNGDVAMPRIARLILENRDDLRRLFPEALSGRSGRYLAWLVTYGRTEYSLTAELVHAAQDKLNELLAAGDRDARTAVVRYSGQIAARTFMDTVRGLRVSAASAPAVSVSPIQVNVTVAATDPTPQIAEAGLASRLPSAMKLNKPCELEDFSDVSAAALIRAVEPELVELYPDYPRAREHRKSWEYQQIIRGATQLRALGDRSDVLVFPAGHERPVYELSNRARNVFACDVYGSVKDDIASCDPFLIDPGTRARQRHRATRLFARHMDARFLRFEAASFDLAVCPAFSSFPRSEELAGNLLLEFERVLKPGGLLVLCVEFVVNAAGHGYAEAELYDPDSLRKTLALAANFEPVEPIQENVSERTLATVMPLATAREEAQHGQSRFPHIILEADGRQFTTATIFVRKLG